jgi:hypothetical protein
MLAKAKLIRDGLRLMRMHPDWTLPSKLAGNPLAWLVQTSDGLIVDVRQLPRAVQEDAYRRGLIPYLPDDGEIEASRSPHSNTHTRQNGTKPTT